jgi:hypothetical protein
MGNQLQDVVVRGVADWLSLAAAPTFAGMALSTALSGSVDLLCASASPLSGMTAMYGLMSAVHLPPWLRLLGRSRGD